MSRLLFLPGLLLALAVASPVAAVGAPTSVHVDLVRTFPVGECPGFDAVGEFHISRTETTFYDASGMPQRLIAHASLAGSRIINATTGAWLTATGMRIITRDLVNGGSTSTGTNVHVIVPGDGTVDISAGRLVQDAEGNIVFEVGRQDGPITDALCTALAS